jgi:hypothetical protein
MHGNLAWHDHPKGQITHHLQKVRQRQEKSPVLFVLHTVARESTLQGMNTMQNSTKPILRVPEAFIPVEHAGELSTFPGFS